MSDGEGEDDDDAPDEYHLYNFPVSVNMGLTFIYISSLKHTHLTRRLFRRSSESVHGYIFFLLTWLCSCGSSAP